MLPPAESESHRRVSPCRIPPAPEAFTGAAVERAALHSRGIGVYAAAFSDVGPQFEVPRDDGRLAGLGGVGGVPHPRM